MTTIWKVMAHFLIGGHNVKSNHLLNPNPYEPLNPKHLVLTSSYWQHSFYYIFLHPCAIGHKIQ
jgi:hypothetical protein